MTFTATIREASPGQFEAEYKLRLVVNGTSSSVGSRKHFADRDAAKAWVENMAAGEEVVWQDR